MSFVLKRKHAEETETFLLPPTEEENKESQDAEMAPPDAEMAPPASTNRPKRKNLPISQTSTATPLSLPPSGSLQTHTTPSLHPTPGPIEEDPSCTRTKMAGMGDPDTNLIKWRSSQMQTIPSRIPAEPGRPTPEQMQEVLGRGRREMEVADARRGSGIPDQAVGPRDPSFPEPAGTCSIKWQYTGAGDPKSHSTSTSGGEDPRGALSEKARVDGPDTRRRLAAIEQQFADADDPKSLRTEQTQAAPEAADRIEEKQKVPHQQSFLSPVTHAAHEQLQQEGQTPAQSGGSTQMQVIPNCLTPEQMKEAHERLQNVIQTPVHDHFQAAQDHLQAARSQLNKVSLQMDWKLTMACATIWNRQIQHSWQKEFAQQEDRSDQDLGCPHAHSGHAEHRRRHSPLQVGWHFQVMEKGSGAQIQSGNPAGESLEGRRTKTQARDGGSQTSSSNWTDSRRRSLESSVCWPRSPAGMGLTASLDTATAVARIQQKRSVAQSMHASGTANIQSPLKKQKQLRHKDDTMGQSKWIKFVAGPMHPE